MSKLRNKYLIKYIAMAAVLFVSAAAALFLGSAELDVKTVFSGLFFGSDDAAAVIMRAIRLPRLLAAFLAGWGLSVSGTLLQSVTGNALASPNIVGVNSGAGFAAILVLCFFPQAFGLLPFVAFIGALAATVITLAIAKRIDGTATTLLLSGVAITALLNAGISFISLVDTDVVATYNYFSIGGVSGVPMARLAVPAVFIAVSYSVALFLSPKIQTLVLGDSLAASLGVRVKALRSICIVCAAASAAAAVSFAGLLGFVGLIAPHMARVVVGENVTRRLISAPFIGGALVVLADMLGRILLSPTEIPVGVVMAALGAPFFIILLLGRKGDA
ncbi:MAG: iron ABC transporter permease [Oscillospiraceae bacterium]|nr:iron ABC transporter permease [Oscillospiraceae bacterium]